ncbi:hypothetical protein [Myxococcus xanthus]|nr:hypothetical protein [Myxococcus xanthus]NOJ54795.1 hypothetical protein [Myxococcus xanthus]QZZ47588.1 hypothetical protein MyxoNM_00130 [Myxococcus xanthus]UYI14731.1 hypothetical protein N3T43_00130 [Myxococcus xanthus]UYI22095.1 hypothetical protein N1129_00130 [Myxococcus xanthus]SDX39430.1 hypothetical protein SAMN05444383_107290 [Myxococcus xanthus]
MSLRWAKVAMLLTACGGAGYRYAGRDVYFGPDGGQVWVRGPWPAIQPSRNVDDVIDQLCPIIMEMDGAREKDYGQEYCGVLYSLGDGVFYASYPSPLGEMQRIGPNKRKSCTSPRYVRDERGRAVGIADYHSHPWAPSPLTPEDRWEKNQRWLIRIQFDTDCHVMKLVPHANEPQPGEVYLRMGRAWELIGIIKPEHKPFGIVTDVGD